MKKTVRIFHTDVIGYVADKQSLIDRWSSEQTEKVRAALLSNADFPQVFPPLEVQFAELMLTLEDLRGVDLSGLRIGNYDLAYCALDYAKLDNCELYGTHLQYSRLVGASLRKAKLKDVQASPIDARSVDMSYSELSSCFLSNSDLESANLLEANVDQYCDLTESNVKLPKKMASVYASLSIAEDYVVGFSAAKLNECIENLSFWTDPHTNKKTVQVGTVVVCKTGKLAVMTEVIAKTSSRVSREKLLKLSRSKERLRKAQHRKKLHPVKAKAFTEPFRLGDLVEIVKAEPRGKFVFKGIKKNKPAPNSQGIPTTTRNESWMIRRVIEKSPPR
jgi:uncharacterized protein YjbI with pentapeptide repeats